MRRPWRLIVQSSNPVLTRLGEAARQEQRLGSPGYGTGYAPGYTPQATSRVMTMDDVVVRTVALLAVTGIFGAGAWALLPPSSAITAIAAIGSIIAGLVLGLGISFMRVTNPAVIIPHPASQGVALGLGSPAF